MFEFLRGTIEYTGTDFVALNVGGAGFRLNVSNQTLGELSGKEGQVTVYTYMSVKEDDISLYGFATNEERSVFMMLISVSGVGPKLALAVLSGISPGEFGTAVARGDHKALSKVKGVGSKTAQRIVLELKDKVCKEIKLADSDVFEDENGNMAIAPDNDAVEALMVLGYTPREAAAAVKKVYKDGMSIDETIRAALRSRIG
ncbi:MAG: Holliday junction branch migration protein RuvA [Clostridia bacterium]|nr:Holliday junction branch migration protein RuvA [Clostridia bacterium]